MRKIIIMICTCIEVSILFVLVGGFTTAITKNIHATVLVEQFKNQATYREELSTPRVKVYTIPSEEEIPTNQKVGGIYYPGSEGDILISLYSEIGIPFVEDIISFFAGGHAGLVLGKYMDSEGISNELWTLEASGLREENNLAEAGNKRYWTLETNERSVIGLRVKMSNEERRSVINRAMALIGDEYNYSFLFDTKNKSYCSDLIGKAFDVIGVNLNKDGFTTSVYDLLVSGETYITYYHYFDTDGVQHVYYLET